MAKPKVAIVHDWLYGGGAELVVEALHNMYPDAPIYTSYCSDEWRRRLHNKVVTGYLQRWPFAQLRKFLPVLRQHWFKQLDLSNFDIIISSSGNGEAKFVRKKAGATHICYCHTPTHFYWRKYDEYVRNPSFRPKWLVRLGLRLLVNPLRKRDFIAAQDVDYFIANSSHIQKDIKKYYSRDSVVIYPPVNVEKWHIGNKKSKIKNTDNSLSNIDAMRPFIMWGRHVPYKRFDLAIKACNELKLPLIIAGTGPETENLENIAGPTVRFVGRVSDTELVNLAHSAAAFLFPGEEDFGIAPVEAMAAGLPVIAYKSGGALDYVLEGKTGTFFERQTVRSLRSTLAEFKISNFSEANIVRSTEKFSVTNFQKAGFDFIEDIAVKSQKIH